MVRCLEIYGEIHPFFNLKLLLMFIISFNICHKNLPHALLISDSVIMSASPDCYFINKADCRKNVSLSFHSPHCYPFCCHIVLCYTRTSFLFIHFFFLCLALLEISMPCLRNNVSILMSANQFCSLTQPTTGCSLMK